MRIVFPLFLLLTHCHAIQIHTTTFDEVQAHESMQKVFPDGCHETDESRNMRLITKLGHILSNHQPGSAHAIGCSSSVLLKWETFLAQAKSLIDEHGSKMNTDCIEQIKPLFMKILPDVMECPSWIEMILQQSSFSVIGFWKIVLLQYGDFILRVHVHNQPAKTQGLHNHQWQFSSTVLFGELPSQDYEVQPDVNPRMLTGDDTFLERPMLQKQRFSDRPDEYTLLHPKVFLRKVKDQRHTAGQSYFLPTEAIHRIIPSAVPTATLVLSETKPVKNFVFDRLSEHQDGRLGILKIGQQLSTKDLRHLFQSEKIKDGHSNRGSSESRSFLI